MLWGRRPPSRPVRNKLPGGTKGYETHRFLQVFLGFPAHGQVPETQEQWPRRARKVVAQIDESHDVAGLCREFPNRLQMGWALSWFLWRPLGSTIFSFLFVSVWKSTMGPWRMALENAMDSIESGLEKCRGPHGKFPSEPPERNPFRAVGAKMCDIWGQDLAQGPGGGTFPGQSPRNEKNGQPQVSAKCSSPGFRK